MLNYIWALMVLVGVVVGICNGRIEELGNGALEAAGSAVTLCITMLGIMSLWMGLMQIARASGLIERMTKGMRPVIRFLFPDLPAESPAVEYIATNMIAYRSQYGSTNPAGIIVPAIMATLLSTLAAVLFCKWKGRKGSI